MESSFRGYWLYVVVFLVAILILLDLHLIHRNNKVITYNKDQQDQAERVKLSTSGVMRSLHLMDMAIRSYAFVKGQHFITAMDLAIKDKNEAFYMLEDPLKAQNYPMEKFYALRDSTESYVAVARHMVDLIDRGDQAGFTKILEQDPGYSVWLQFQQFSAHVNSFEEDIVKKADERYAEAINHSYLLQLLLFIIAVPTLAYTAFQTNKTLSVSQQLAKSEQEKTSILEKQNQMLEWTVHERTREVMAKNEQISLHNDRLKQAKTIIEDQNKVIRQQNDELANEVKRQTVSLIQANTELMQHNQRLEQFGFIISHNLRAPMSRIVGLSSLLDFAKDASEISDIARLMTRSTQELDQIIRDLTEILGIQKMSSHALNDIALEQVTMRVMSMLQTEIEETAATITCDFSAASYVRGITGYLESIVYNLISNAIKYRHPNRVPEISIVSRNEGAHILLLVTDNGLGIDLQSHQQNLFSLYKRFHLHVEGRGIGLYLVKSQMVALGGKIEIASEEGNGTTFMLWFKKLQAAEITA